MNKAILNNVVRPALDALPAAAGLLKSDESMFEFVIVAAQRCKQLSGGASPRVGYDVSNRKNTSIALEEVKNGMISFTTTEVAKT